MADFKKQGGSLTGREERYDGFEGEPRAVGSTLGGSGSGVTGSSGTTGTGYGSTNAGPHSSNLENKMDPRVDSDMDGRRGVETGSAYGSGTTGSGYGSGNTGSGYGSGSTGTGYDSTGTAPKKASMMDKLNPKKDSDGDGKPGFMK